ncbi:MAG: hypothetical protein K6U74_07000 [Firmicutes bacterium]|nr:hypothetical protein [Bacillota bacterium]
MKEEHALSITPTSLLVVFWILWLFLVSLTITSARHYYIAKKGLRNNNVLLHLFLLDILAVGEVIGVRAFLLFFLQIIIGSVFITISYYITHSYIPVKIFIIIVDIQLYLWLIMIIRRLFDRSQYGNILVRQQVVIIVFLILLPHVIFGLIYSTALLDHGDLIYFCSNLYYPFFYSFAIYYSLPLDDSIYGNIQRLASTDIIYSLLQVIHVTTAKFTELVVIGTIISNLISRKNKKTGRQIFKRPPSKLN